MKRLTMSLIALIQSALSLCSANSQTQQSRTARLPSRSTIFPAGMADRMPAADITAMTAKLLGTLRDQKIPCRRLRQRKEAL